MELIKKLIREELEKVLSTLEEVEFAQGVDLSKTLNPKDDIIYDYEPGIAFSGDNLEVDIVNLNRYHLVDYLPKSETQELWSFEFETVYGITLIVDIDREIKIGTSVWSMKFGQLYKDNQTPVLIAELLDVPNYDNFINSVNKKMSAKIDPSKF